MRCYIGVQVALCGLGFMTVLFSGLFSSRRYVCGAAVWVVSISRQ